MHQVERVSRFGGRDGCHVGGFCSDRLLTAGFRVDRFSFSHFFFALGREGGCYRRATGAVVQQYLIETEIFGEQFSGRGNIAQQ